MPHNLRTVSQQAMHKSSFRKQSKHGASDSLISFDSWDFSATDTWSETTTSGSSSSWSKIEDSEHSSSSALPTPHGLTGAAPLDATRQVSVSGVIFSLKASTFAKLNNLPWTWLQEPTGFEGYSLETSPVLFELLLNYIMFGNLPKLADMSLADAEELEPLASILRLEELRCHLDRKLRPNTFAFFKRLSNSHLGDVSIGASPVSFVRKHVVSKSMSMLLPAPCKRHHRKLSLEQLSSISNQLQ